jgi:C1A family cysteine protease
MPAAADRVIGGHAVLVGGHDNATKRFLVRNSWGEGWGQGGYFTIPCNYLCDPNLAQVSEGSILRTDRLMA